MKMDMFCQNVFIQSAFTKFNVYVNFKYNFMSNMNVILDGCIGITLI